MCVNFTDLNRAYPKDNYPLPCSDLFIDLTVWHQLLSFMDAFSNYNQIKVDEANQEKTSVVTSQWLFCYKVIPFRLKNAEVTYQRLMKSTNEGRHLDDLWKTFKTLHLYNMKLNPSKYLFRVSSRKFLGFIVSQRCMKANPDKIHAILEMTPPKNINEVQRFNGRVAALNRFIFEAIDKCLPFFKTLKKAFEWTNGCQKAFKELKVYLASPLLLSPSKLDEELSLSLVVSLMVISSALI